MKNKIKVTFLITILACLAVSATVFAAVLEGTWVGQGYNWKFQKTDGTFVISDWGLIKYTESDGSTNYGDFYFDETGTMAIGIKKIGNDYYAFNSNGTAKSNSQVDVGGTTYSTKRRGKLADVYKELDIAKYNADLMAQLQYVETNKDAIAQQAAEEEAKKAVNAELDKDAEKYGPRSTANKIRAAEMVGPGQGLN